MPLPPKKLIVIASVSMALAIMLGAFGAHTLGENQAITEKYLKTWQTASNYHLLQTLGLFIIAFAGTWFQLPKTKQIFNVLLIGIILFSGSLYLISVNEIAGEWVKKAGPVTPVGGVFMIAAWLWLVWGLVKSKHA